MSIGRHCYGERIPAGCFRAKTVSLRTGSCSVSRSRSAFRKPSACGLRSISFDTLRRRFISSTTREIMRRSGECFGHRNITTTIKFYCGLETIAASEQFGKLIREQIEFDDEPDA